MTLKQQNDTRAPHNPASRTRFRIRSNVERFNAHLKDWLLPDKVMVRGHSKVTFCLMSGVLCLMTIVSFAAYGRWRRLRSLARARKRTAGLRICSLAASEAVLLSPVVIGELYEGFPGGSRNLENRRVLNRFREKLRTVCVPLTDVTAEWFAEIKRSLRRRGTPIPINDVWIAASCMEHGAQLLSFDRHFDNVDELLMYRFLEV